MLTFEQRIEDFSKLGDLLIDDGYVSSLAGEAQMRNGWFTPENVHLAVRNISTWLKKEALSAWIRPYVATPQRKMIVGTVMAGNIPLVGFHDLLAVLLSGHTLHAKLSHQDNFLLPRLFGELCRINPAWESEVVFTEQLKQAEAVIATGSNNSARYFEYYFKDRPLLLRKNRSSVAVLNGMESPESLLQLGHDLFSYFGLGCRNVSKIYMPEGYDLNTVIKNILPFGKLLDHHKYANCYTYQRAVLLVDQQTFTDNGFCVFQDSKQISSPVSVIFTETYKHPDSLRETLESRKEEIQCVVSAMKEFPSAVEFGKTQSPGLTDYADDMNTLEFLSKLNG
ncbi:MAG: acyl-CoA reductase [Bacteroidetes bacterium]|nr:acyl-CoA reductase [Bacteroidota bacterium]